MNFMEQLSELGNVGEQEGEVILHSLNNVRSIEVIDFRDGTKLGFIKDLVIDISENRVKSIVLPSIGKGWFGRDEEIEIPWENVKKVGLEVIIVDTTNLEIFDLKNNI